jgi:uroporphyrinogen decarboxylase
LIASVLDEPLPSPSGSENNPDEKTKMLDQRIRFWHGLGLDAIWQGAELNLPGLLPLKAQDTALLSRQSREWANEKKGAVSNWEDFEHYPWPKTSDADYSAIEYLIKHLPEGMGIIASTIGMLEPLMYLAGFETLSYALYDDPDFIQAICSKIADTFFPIAENLVQMDRVIALGMADDMGYKTGLLISAEHLRRYIFPYQKRVARIAHERGLPFLLHSCGQLEPIMDDLLYKVQVDARHSFEDIIEPVESFVARHGDKMAAIGGVDMDILGRGTEAQVRLRTRQILEACSSSGAYILGSGNSIANYVPVRNFLAMIDEGWRFNSQ